MTKDHRLMTKAFTLIELLLGLTIFSMIALVIYGTFSGGLLINERSQGQGEVTREARISLELMAKELENMVPYEFSASSAEEIAFKGEENKISFIIPTDNGLKRVSYYLISPEQRQIKTTVMGKTYKKNVSVITKREETSRLKYLVREETDFKSSGSISENTKIEILATHVIEDTLRFSYAYMEDEKSQEITWKNEWNLKDIPLSVRIEINFLKSSKGDLPMVKDVLIPSGYFGMDTP